MNKTNIKAFVITGGATYAAAKYVFDASTTKAVVAGVIVGAIAIALISISFPTPQPVTTP
jgi:hypothetical protein